RDVSTTAAIGRARRRFILGRVARTAPKVLGLPTGHVDRRRTHARRAPSTHRANVRGARASGAAFPGRCSVFRNSEGSPAPPASRVPPAVLNLKTPAAGSARTCGRRSARIEQAGGGLGVELAVREADDELVERELAPGSHEPGDDPPAELAAREASALDVG